MAAPRGTLDDLKVILADLRACAERLAAVGPGKADDPTFLAAKTDASLAFLKIRAVNRDVLNDLEKTRERTSAHKTELDEARLQLQNVLYEKLHIQKEIRACEDFTSAYSDEEIGLRDVKEFMEREGIKEGELDPHELMLKRLSSELAERKALCEEEKELKAKRKRLQDGIDERRKFLDGLGAQLESLKRATAPLQSHLNLPIAFDDRQKRAARLLPPPLYVAYTQLAAAREAFQDTYEVNVDGSIADAEALVRKAAAEEETARARERGGDDAEAADAMETDDGEIRGEIRDKREGDDDDGGDADADADADAGGGRAKKRAKRGASDGGGGGKGRTSGTGGGDDANETYAQHPLVVVLDVDGVSFVFRYLMNLHVVTVEAMKTDEKKKRAGRATKEKEEKGRARGGGDANAADAPPPVDLTRGDLLVNLFPDDDGLDTPNAANKLRYPAGFAYPDVSTRRDRPYKWAQHLAGLDFLPPVPAGRAPPDATEAARGVEEHTKQRRVRNVLRALRARMASRRGLESQLDALGRKDIDALSVAKRLEMHPKCALREWRETTRAPATAKPRRAAASATPVDEDGEVIVAETPAAAAAAEENDDDDDDDAKETTTGSAGHGDGARTFDATIRSKSAAASGSKSAPPELRARVVVYPDYPHRPPSFSLELARGVPPKPLPKSDLDAEANGGNGHVVSVTHSSTAEDDVDASARNDLRLAEEEVNVKALTLVPAGAADEVLGYQVVRLMQALDAYGGVERWGGATDEEVGVRQMRRGRERRKELPPLL